MDTNTLDATAIICNVERYLAAQYAKRKVTEKPAGGVVVILAWCVVVILIWK